VCVCVCVCVCEREREKEMAVVRNRQIDGHRERQVEREGCTKKKVRRKTERGRERK
jgi:hypothetical protein